MIELIVKKPAVELNASLGGYADGYENGYDSGYNVGYQNGYDEGNQEGLQEGYAETYDAFWDMFQENGNRTNYQYGFGGWGWTDETFKPKYPIVCNGSAECIFYTNKTVWEDKVLQVDFSKATSLFGAFYGSSIAHIGKCDFSSATNINAVFQACGAQTIEEVVSHAGLAWAGAFNRATNLESIAFSGVIGTSISFINSALLTTASVNSIINALKDLTGATAQTLTLHADVKNKLTQEQKNAIKAKNWTLA